MFLPTKIIYSISITLSLVLHLTLLLADFSTTKISTKLAKPLFSSINVYLQKNKKVDLPSNKKSVAENKKQQLNQIADIQSKENFLKKRQNDFLVGLRKLIEKQKFYPNSARALGQDGAVMITFDLQKNGSLTNIKILSSSRYPILDQAAIETIQKVGYYMPIPNDFAFTKLTLTQKISYQK